MAQLTKLGPEDAARITAAHGLGPPEIVPILAGSVNSNFFLDTPEGRFFLRLYEEQQTEGVAFEWALLDHLGRHAIRVPRRVAGPAPGEVRVAGKPTALFHLARGEMSCQAAVSEVRAQEVGRFLGRAHLAERDFGWRRGSRFQRSQLRERFPRIRREAPELEALVLHLEGWLDRLDGAGLEGLPSGIVHGDLFRDNVFWEGDALTCAIDWESAALGAYVYDLGVAILAWCFGDTMRWDLGAAMVAGYQEVRALTEPECDGLQLVLAAGAVRFAITRVTDFHLRAEGEGIRKDYRRFVARLEAVTEGSPAALAARLGL